MGDDQTLCTRPDTQCTTAAKPPAVSQYLRHAARPLFVACRDAGRDQGGAACPTCLLKTICDAGRLRYAEQRRHCTLS